MAVEVAHVRIVAEFVPARRRDPEVADDLAVAEPPGAGCQRRDPAHAKSVDDDERAVSQCDQRHQWADGTGDPAGDSGWGTGSVQAGETEALPDPSQRRRDCAQSGRELAGRCAVRTAAGSGAVRVSPAANRGVRHGTGEVSGKLAEPDDRRRRRGRRGSRGEQWRETKPWRQATQEPAAVPTGRGIDAGMRSEPDEHPRSRRDDGADVGGGVGGGYESVADGEALGVVVKSGAETADQRRKADPTREESIAESGGGCAADGGEHLTRER